MFETGEEMSRNEGLKGILTRHFGPVVDRDVARDGIHTIAHVFLVLACIAALRTYFAGPLSLIDALGLGIPALFLRFRQSRVAAIVLLVFTAFNAALAFPQLLPWLWVLFALRAVQVTFGYHRLQKAPTDTEMVSTFE
jgi:formate hydrogenlyase subunit 4